MDAVRARAETEQRERSKAAHSAAWRSGRWAMAEFVSERNTGYHITTRSARATSFIPDFAGNKSELFGIMTTNFHYFEKIKQ